MTALVKLFRAHPWWSAALAAALVAGATLRLIWPGAVEYKADEHWMFVKSQTLGKTESFSWFGMPTSASFLNPGMNVWVFWGLGQFLQADSPPELARGVQLLSILTLILYVAFVVRCVPDAEREPWWWGLALMALCPIAVLFHRKIWQPCLFPIFTFAWLLGWWRRERWWGAFLWGLVGAILGQIQLAGLFFAAGTFLWVFCFARRQVRWGWWLAGSALGALPLLPWLFYMMHRPAGDEIHGAAWLHLISGQFWHRWLLEAFGISAQYPLGADFGDFLRYPLIAGVPTYGMLLLHGVLGLVIASVICLGVAHLWRERKEWRRWFLDRSSPTAFTLQAILWGFGLCMTATLMPCHRHYLLIAMPFVYVWLARALLCSPHRALARALLLALCIAHALISFQFLGYVYENGAHLRGQFGIPYAAQMKGSGTHALAKLPPPVIRPTQPSSWRPPPPRAAPAGR